MLEKKEIVLFRNVDEILAMEMERATVLLRRAEALRAVGRIAEARDTWREAEGIRKKLSGKRSKENMSVVTAISGLGLL